PKPPPESSALLPRRLFDAGESCLGRLVLPLQELDRIHRISPVSPYIGRSDSSHGRPADRGNRRPLRHRHDVQLSRRIELQDGCHRAPLRPDPRLLVASALRLRLLARPDEHGGSLRCPVASSSASAPARISTSTSWEMPGSASRFCGWTKERRARCGG